MFSPRQDTPPRSRSTKVPYQAIPPPIYNKTRACALAVPSCFRKHAGGLSTLLKGGPAIEVAEKTGKNMPLCRVRYKKKKRNKCF